MTVKILVVDNYDSFVYTIVDYLTQLGATCDVVRNDAISADSVTSYAGVLVSPGPGTPDTAGVTLDLIRACGEHRVPMLGVCLGHQALGQVFGGTVARAEELMHGKTSHIQHGNTGVFEGLPQPVEMTRYHSLVVVPDTVPDELEVTATTADGVVMGLAHRTLPLTGVQFHPESVLSVGGHRLLANWLATCGLSGAVERSATLTPRVGATA